MRKLWLAAPVVIIGALGIRAADWPSQNGSPQRDGWARAEKAFTAENAGKIELLYKYKADNQARGPNALTSPMVNGMLITYLGFKEMLVFGGSSDNVYSVDADLNRTIWKRHFDYQGDRPAAAPTATCPGGLTASMAMPGSSSAAGRGGPGGGRGGAGGGRGLFATGFGRSGVFLAVSSDGFLHALNTSTGADKVPPVKFVPPNSKLSALNVNDSVVYAATLDNCGGNPPALYALDMSGDEPKLTSAPLPGRGAQGSAGTAISPNGFVFSQSDSLLEFTKDLQPKGSFPVAGSATPLVFQWKGKDIVAAGGDDGRLYLLDAANLSEPVAKSEPVKGHYQGAFSSWEEADGKTRWIYAPVSDGSGGNIVAYKIEDKGGTVALSTVWTSGTIASPAPVVTANGLVFSLSTGEPKGHATLFVLNGTTGKQLYSSANAIATFAHNGGLAVANRRIYLTAHDNTVYCFGFMADQPQLTGK